jgi:hypothetical protein
MRSMRSVCGAVGAAVLALTLTTIPVMADDVCEAFAFKQPSKLDDEGGKKLLDVPNGLHLIGRYQSPLFGTFDFKTEVKDGKRADEQAFLRGRPLRFNEGGRATPESISCLQKRNPTPQTTLLQKSADWLMATAIDLATGSPAYARGRPLGCTIMVTITCYGTADNPGRTCVAHEYCGSRYMGYYTMCEGSSCPSGPPPAPGPKGKNNKPKT